MAGRSACRHTPKATVAASAEARTTSATPLTTPYQTPATGIRKNAGKNVLATTAYPTTNAAANPGELGCIAASENAARASSHDGM